MKIRSLSFRALAVRSVVLAHSLVAAGVYAQGTPLPVELLPLGKDLGLRSGQTVTPPMKAGTKMKMAAGSVVRLLQSQHRRGGQYSDRAVKPHCGSAGRSA